MLRFLLDNNEDFKIESSKELKKVSRRKFKELFNLLGDKLQKEFREVFARKIYFFDTLQDPYNLLNKSPDKAQTAFEEQVKKTLNILIKLERKIYFGKIFFS